MAGRVSVVGGALVFSILLHIFLFRRLFRASAEEDVSQGFREGFSLDFGSDEHHLAKCWVLALEVPGVRGCGGSLAEDEDAGWLRGRRHYRWARAEIGLAVGARVGRR